MEKSQNKNNNEWLKKIMFDVWGTNQRGYDTFVYKLKVLYAVFL